MAGNETAERWLLDGERIEDFGAFLRENAEGLTVDEAMRCATMKPGDELVLGGGAGAEFTLRREA